MACAALALMSLAWSLASPVGSSPDEQAHIIYAWGVATGQTTPWSVQEVEGQEAARYAKVTVPVTLLKTPAVCNRFQPETPACATIKPVEDPDNDGMTSVLTYMDRYPPAYYLPIGLVLRAAIALGASGITATTLARIVSGVLGLGVILQVWTTMVKSFDRQAVTGAVAAIMTPMVLFLNASINPNGLEVGLTALLAATVVVVRAHLSARQGVPRWLTAQLLISALVLGLTRPASVLWMLLLLMILIAPIHGRKGECGVAPFRRIGVAPLCGLAITVVITLVAFIYDNATRGGGAAGKDLSTWFALPREARWTAVLLQLGNLVESGYRYLGWGDTPLPELFFITWIVGWVTVLVGVTRADAGTARTASLLPAGSFLVLASLAVAIQSERSGFAWQGRYFLPVIAGFIVLLVAGTAPRPSEAAASPRLAVGFALTQGLIAVLSLAITAWRYLYGFRETATHFDALALPSLGAAGSWTPALPVRVILALGTISVALIIPALMLALRSRQASQSSGSEPDTTWSVTERPDHVNRTV